MSAESGAPENSGTEFKPITSQDDLNRIIADRVSRERGKFADYEDLKVKASKLDQLEAEKLTETQRLQAQLDELSGKASAAEKANARLSVIASEGIPAEYQDLVHGDTPEALAASAKKAKELIDKANAVSQKPLTSYRVNLDGDGSDALALNGSGIEDALKKKLGIS